MIREGETYGYCRYNRKQMSDSIRTKTVEAMKDKTTFLRLLALFLLPTVCSMAWSANTIQTISQLNRTTTISGNIDYTITGDTPFGTNGAVNITNIEHAVLILSKVRPSAAMTLLPDHVKINGAQAVDGQNCQVKMYGQGTIIMPYASDIKPLTVYSGQNFSGEAVNDFGLEDTNGFMNTLTDAKLNNRIRSFRLKRGYMVTFSLRPGGYGYSRCFIAADQDLEIASLPAVMDEKISSYRLFKWNDTSKKALATADGDFTFCSALNVTSTYTWGVGQDMTPDVESVPHHIKENWPTASELGVATWSPHMKTNNEPQNPNDDPWVKQSVSEILANWEGLMATGMRLCSPSSWDGSDYWNGTGFLKEFFDSIDARGWRCDIIDLHGYWLLSNFQTNIPNWYNAVKRPVWVSEWVWGASWNTNGAFADGVTEAENAANVKSICEYMNGLPYVERYYYWNNEADISKLYKNGTLTAAGEYYAAMDPGLGYTGAAGYVPAEPPIKAPVLTNVTAAGKVNLRWNNDYGDLYQSMTLEYSSDGGSWQTVATFGQNDVLVTYTHEASMGGGLYRVRAVDYLGSEHISGVANVTSGNVFYLYNVGAQQWLTSGNAWGTHASLVSYGGIDVMTTEGADGQYTIDTQLVNGDNHFMNMLDNGPWMDQTQGQWTFTECGADGAFLLTCNGKNLAYDGTTTSLVGSDATDAGAQWLFMTRDDRMEQLSKATAMSPVDASFLIVDNDFARYNDTRRAYWQGGPVVGGHFDGTRGNQCAEKYNTTFDVFQTISGAPAGVYRLEVQGFYRNGGYADAATRHNNGTEHLDAVLYANNASVSLQSIFSEAGKLDVGVTTSGIDGKFPNNMDDAALFFLTDTLYANSLEFTLDEEQDLRIGIRKSKATASDWTIFDNFRLVYLGLPPVPYDVNGDRTVNGDDVVCIVRHLIGLTPDDYHADVSDIDGNGVVNIADVACLISILVKSTSSF